MLSIENILTICWGTFWFEKLYKHLEQFYSKILYNHQISKYLCPKESIGKNGNCAYQNKRGFIGFLYDDSESNFGTFASGNENFNRRFYEHFLRPRASKNFVVAPTAIALGLTVLAIGSQNNQDGVLQGVYIKTFKNKSSIFCH